MKPKRRYLQFSLGTMFLTVTALCIWLGVQVKWMRDRQEARIWLKEHDCEVISGIAYLDDPFWTGEETPAPWSIRMLGEEGVSDISLNLYAISNVEAKSRKTELKQLFPEAHVRISRTHIPRT